MVLGKLSVPGRPTICSRCRWGLFGYFYSHLSFLSSFSLSLGDGPLQTEIRGWSGGAMVLGKVPVPVRPTIWMIVGQGPIALAVGADGGCFDIFTLIILSLLFLPLFGRRPDIN